jgi:hypothetical protein
MRLLLLVPLCMVSIAMQAEGWKKNYQVAGKPDILVTAGIDIDVEVRVWDNASVEAKVVTEGWPVKKIHIQENQEGDRIELRVGPPHVSISTHARSARVQLRVPPQSDLEIKSDTGHVTVDQVKGKVQVSPGTTTKSFVITTVSGAPHIERQ